MFSKCGAAQSKRHSFHFNYLAEICGCYSHVCRQVGPHLNVNEAEICQKYRFRSLQVLCLSSRRQPKLIVLLHGATVSRRRLPEKYDNDFLLFFKRVCLFNSFNYCRKDCFLFFTNRRLMIFNLSEAIIGMRTREGFA